MGTVRLDKFLAMNGYGTRSEVKKLLKGGQVCINDIPEKKPETKLDPREDVVTVQGQKISYQEFFCLMLNKPSGCVTATEDPAHPTVLDLISHSRKKELFPTGRLDIDTEGLLFLMNDGELSHRMLSPRHHVEKTYFVRTKGVLDEEDMKAFEEGMDIGEKHITLPARLHILVSDSVSEAEVTICEGKFHQIKRMFAARGKEVLYLKRISMAGISLDPALGAGEWRELTPEEMDILQSLKIGN